MSEESDIFTKLKQQSRAFVAWCERRPEYAEVVRNADGVYYADYAEVLEQYRAAVWGAGAGGAHQAHSTKNGAPADDSTYEGKVTALRVAYRTRLLQIAVADILADDPLSILPGISAALADAATAVLQVALEILNEGSRTPTPPPSTPKADCRSDGGCEGAVVRPLFSVSRNSFPTTRRSADQGAPEGAPLSAAGSRVESNEFTVIAMGKCGARELNYISDIDLVYIASEECIASGLANKLATGIAQICNGIVGSEPGLWEVDTALRPEGKVGALVRTIESSRAYYEKWADTWEFQALFKARAVAGDLELGRRYEEMVQEFVWTAATRENFVADCQKMRARVIENIPANIKQREIKLGVGGLRDIEFTVQLLQLVHGRSDKAIRAKSTLTAISELATGGYIGRADAAQIGIAYRFLRYIEHRVQFWDMRRTHLFPDTPEGIARLAKHLHMTSDEFLERYNRTRALVRKLHLAIYYRPMLEYIAKLTPGELTLTSSAALERLTALGFEDVQAVSKHIEALALGQSRKSLIMRQILPTFLMWVSEGVDKQNGLLEFRKISEKVGDAPWFLGLLRDNNIIAERLAFVLTNSKCLANALTRHPRMIEWLSDERLLSIRSADSIKAEFQAVLSRTPDLESSTRKLADIREWELGRLALSYVFGFITDSAVAEAISLVTDLLILEVLRLVNEKFGTSLQAIAMGRYGGKEMGFASDADIVLVHADEQPDQSTNSAEIVTAALAFKQLITGTITTSTFNLQLDFDLRPEGKNGSLVRSITSYDTYYSRFADTWEFQALLRARVIGENPELTRIIDQHRYRPNRLDSAAILEIRKLKARVETERARTIGGQIDLKLGPGGLSDVEWLVQLKQLEYAGEHPEFRTVSTLEALDAAAANNGASSPVTAHPSTAPAPPAPAIAPPSTVIAGSDPQSPQSNKSTATEAISPHERTSIKGASEASSTITAQERKILLEAWLLASRLRNANALVLQGDILADNGRSLAMINKLLHTDYKTNYEIYDNYRRVSRQARAVFEELFFVITD
jgi:glutamate-ammonia-ligase adenylyltransferase